MGGEQVDDRLIARNEAVRRGRSEEEKLEVATITVESCADVGGDAMAVDMADALGDVCWNEGAETVGDGVAERLGPEILVGDEVEEVDRCVGVVDHLGIFAAEGTENGHRVLFDSAVDAFLCLDEGISRAGFVLRRQVWNGLGDGVEGGDTVELVDEVAVKVPQRRSRLVSEEQRMERGDVRGREGARR